MSAENVATAGDTLGAGTDEASRAKPGILEPRVGATAPIVALPGHGRLPPRGVPTLWPPGGDRVALILASVANHKAR